MGAKTTKEIAEFVCNTGYRDLPSEVIDYAKILALSHLGTNLAGATMEFGKKVNDYVKGKGAYPESGVFGAGFRTCADYAALANGNSANATELKDKSPGESMYSCGHWPSVFAMGEKLKLPGRDVIEALVIGYEVASKLAMAYKTALAKGTSPSACCAIGNAASIAKMLRLNVAQTTSALSLAASQVAGISKQNGSGAHVIEPGLGGRNGICAAELASLGYTGQSDILEGKFGFGDIWSNCPEFDLPLGEDYILMRVSIRKYACVGMAKRYIDGILDLIVEHNLAWDDVASVEHGISYMRSNSFKYDQPTTEEEARFSLHHITVACFLDNKMFLPSFTTEKVLDPHWREARKKVKVTVHPEWTDADALDSPMTIIMRDGRRYQKVCRDRGNLDDHPSSAEDAMEKYLGCVDFASTFSRSRTEQIAYMTLGLDKLEDVSALTALLTYPDQA